MTSVTDTPRSLRLEAPVTGWDAPVESDVAATESGAPAPLRRFAMTAYTGGPMRLTGWTHPVVVDLAGLRVTAKSRPILKDHNRALIVGHTDGIRVDADRLEVTGVISGAGVVAREVVESSRNGFPWQASVGATAERVDFVPKGRRAQANGREFEGPLHIARKATLGEVSFVALGADDDTTAQITGSPATGSAIAAGRSENDTMQFDQWLEAKGFAETDLSAAQATSLRAMFETEGAEPPAASTASATIDADDDPVARMRADAAAETARIATIRRVCAATDGRHAELEARAISEGWDETRTELEVLRAERPAIRAGGVRRDGDDGTSARAIEAALCLSAGIAEPEVGQWYDERTMNAAVTGRMRGAGLHTAFAYAIEAAGQFARTGHVDNDFILTALEADRTLRGQERSIRASGGGFSTISLAGILSNVANKSMLAAYQAVDSVIGSFCADADVADFKEVTRYRLTGNGVFEKVGPDGELKHTTLSEAAYTNRVETFGRIFALTRQMIINDDLGAFLQIPRIIGRMSALKREEAVFELLLSNPSSFFSVGNGNFISGADTALNIDALTRAEQTFMDQTDSDGKPILISPAVLLVPTSLKVTAQQLMTETRVNETTDANKPKPANNPHAGKWQPVASPYLNAQGIAGGSSKAWYLFANPADVAAIEIAYLRGRRVPTIESGETNFNTLGMQWRGYFDFGVAMQDHRAAVKSKGEA